MFQWLKRPFSKKRGKKAGHPAAEAFEIRPEEYGKNLKPQDIAWRGTFGDARTNHPGAKL